ncbi:uncharacterized protein LOC126867809 isoform X1 [Bombus huntii]|uniref:uncharacterized protein LOC126867809 isoform X1 n=1 Tax=Bombus huntii TaxID=85661 RepID=UPI0021AABFB6|nr:uncharacterized protein LOC126867809 isoform X1 [Bombus huntii]
MKSKSTSVQNFGNFVEQMIDEALENNEQMTQFHRMIYEKWNIKKLSELENTEWMRNENKSLESDKQNISATVAHRRSRRHKHKRSSLMIFCKIPKSERNLMGQSLTMQAHNSVSIVKKQSTTNKSDNFSELNDINFGDTKIVELWKNSTKRATDELQIATNNVLAKACKPDRIHGLVKQQQSRRKLSFEDWKDKKTVIYQQILRKIETERQRKLLENLANMKWKKVIRQAQIRKKQEDKYRQKQKLFRRKHFETTKRTGAIVKSNCDSIHEAQIINECVLYTPKNQKEIKLDKEKRIVSNIMQGSKLNSAASNGRKNKTVLMEDSMENIKFYFWLNQLNCALHKKYLRERRHLVRSFYCQPFYYGSATPYIK